MTNSLNLLEKLLSKIKNKYSVNPKTECWEWNRSLNTYGYGSSFMIQGKQYSPHRASYLIYKGEIPEGLCIDHLCVNRKCINPKHLEAITWGENTRRGWNNTRERAPKGTYPNPHPLAEIRKAHGVDQTALSNACGYKNGGFISNVERGFRGLTSIEAKKIADFLGKPEYFALLSK